TVVNMLDMPPRENSSSIAGTPDWLSKPLAIAANIALTSVAPEPSRSSATNAVTASDCTNGASIPAKMAEPRMARNGGILSTANATRSSSGSRQPSDTWNTFSGASAAAAVLTDPDGLVTSPMT